MAKIQKQRNIKVRIVTGEQIDFISDKLGYSKAEFLAQVFDNLFNVSMDLTKGCNVTFDYDVIERNALKIIFSGKSNMVVGEVKSPDAQEESKFPEIVSVKFKGEKEYKEVKQP
jgi:hypothetical protein